MRDLLETPLGRRLTALVVELDADRSVVWRRRAGNVIDPALALLARPEDDAQRIDQTAESLWQGLVALSRSSVHPEDPEMTGEVLSVGWAVLEQVVGVPGLAGSGVRPRGGESLAQWLLRVPNASRTVTTLHADTPPVEQLRSLVNQPGLSVTRAAADLLVAGRETVSRWVSGKIPLSDAAVSWIARTEIVAVTPEFVITKTWRTPPSEE